MIEKISDFKLISSAFPTLGAKLKLFWGYPEFTTLMDELLVYQRGVPREGFPPDILFALNTLEALHNMAHPKLAKKHNAPNWHDGIA